ncbi:hypothetical protein F4824DRAFT_516350 [Ustulina deusta]|nr:hypothetical protein F4824DRAFT_516350 [Ustulina deusta]
MCILIYYICSKCFCGYPRFTERCSSMHPPLIHCPTSTQFKFRVVEETECHLHPHHAPLLHLGANGEDTVLSVSPSGSGPVIEEVTHIPLEQDGTASRAAEDCTTLQIAPILRSASFEASHVENTHRARDEQQSQQNGQSRSDLIETTQTTDTDGRPTADGWRANGSSWNHRNFASQNHSRPQRRAANSSNGWGKENRNFFYNKTTKGSAPRGKPQSSSFYGYYANWGPPRAPFDFRYRARSYPQYQYYPYQAAPMPPFQAPSVTTPPGCTYMPVQGWGQHYQHRGRAPPPGFHASSNQMAPEQMRGNDTSVSQLNQYRKQPFNPQASCFESYLTGKEKSKILRENLEQLQRSSDAAYGNCPHHGNDQSLFNCDDGDATPETSPPLVHGPQPDMPNAKDACHATQRGNNPCFRRRSLSESCIQRLSTSEISRPTILFNYKQNVDGKDKEDILSPSPTWGNVCPCNKSNGIATQANGDGVNDTETHQQVNLLWREEVEGCPEAGQNFVVNVNPLNNLEAQDQAMETDSADFSEASVRAECNVAIKQESDDEDYKQRMLTEWITPSIQTDPESKVKLYDISLAAQGQQALSQVRSEDRESDVDIGDWHNAFEPPRVPPNSPIPSLSSSEGTYTHSSTFENDSQPATKDDDIHGIDMQIHAQPPLPTGEAFLDNEPLKATTTSEAPVASPIDFNSDASSKTHETSSADVSKNMASSPRQSKPNVVAPALKLWSAVVSGKYVPSESPDPFPARVPAPASFIPTTIPTNALGLILEEPAADSPVTAPQTFPERPNNASTVPTPVRPISSKTMAHPTPPPNSPTNPASASAAPEHSLEMLHSVLERRFPSDSSLEPDDFAAVTKTTNGESNETAPTSVTQPAQRADSTAPATPVQPVESAPMSQPTPTAPAPTSAATESRASPPPRAWSQLFQGSGRAKKLTSLKPKSENSIDEANWPSLGSWGANNARKRNTSS